VTDKPIIFSAPMVKAMLAGRKSQTRRILKLPTKGIYERKDMGGWAPTINGGGGSFTIARDGTRKPAPETVGIWHQTTGTCLDAPWQAGHRLWVRETWADVNTSCGPGIGYRADGDFYQPEYDGEDFGAGPSYNYDKYPGHYTMWFSDLLAGSSGHAWRSPIHMPRWASRLTLIVTDVRVQRLQDISEADCDAEGVSQSPLAYGTAQVKIDDKTHYGWSAYELYRDLWNSLHGPDAWAANPWVAAVSFRVIRANIDAPEARAA
jgi:hypothetical protein